jgi:hypothetical protein
MLWCVLVIDCASQVRLRVRSALSFRKADAHGKDRTRYAARCLAVVPGGDAHARLSPTSRFDLALGVHEVAISGSASIGRCTVQRE